MFPYTFCTKEYAAECLKVGHGYFFETMLVKRISSCRIPLGQVSNVSAIPVKWQFEAFWNRWGGRFCG